MMKHKYYLAALILFSIVMVFLWYFVVPIATVGEIWISRFDLAKEIKLQREVLHSPKEAHDILLELVNSYKEVELLKREFPDEYARLAKVSSRVGLCDTDAAASAENLFGKSKFNRYVLLPVLAGEYLKANFKMHSDRVEAAKRAAQLCIANKACWVPGYLPTGNIRAPNLLEANEHGRFYVTPIVRVEDSLVGTEARLGDICDLRARRLSFTQVLTDEIAKTLKPMQVHPVVLEDVKSFLIVRRMWLKKGDPFPKHEILEFYKETYSDWFGLAALSVKEKIL